MVQFEPEMVQSLHAIAQHKVLILYENSSEKNALMDFQKRLTCSIKLC